MTPYQGKTILFRSSQQLPRLSWILDSPRALVLELQRYKDTVRGVELGTDRGPRTLSTTIGTNHN